MFFSFSLSLRFFNSFLNPVIYTLRMNQFRVAFIEFVFRTDEEIEMPRFLRVRNSLVRVNVEQKKRRTSLTKCAGNKENVYPTTTIIKLTSFLSWYHVQLYIQGKRII